jgi:sulfur carrier protein
VLNITVNGEPRAIEPDATIASLMARLDVAGKRYAVERNGEIVPKSRHGETRLADGDTLEVVIAVGGG